MEWISWFFIFRHILRPHACIRRTVKFTWGDAAFSCRIIRTALLICVHTELHTQYASVTFSSLIIIIPSDSPPHPSHTQTRGQSKKRERETDRQGKKMRQGGGKVQKSLGNQCDSRSVQVRRHLCFDCMYIWLWYLCVTMITTLLYGHRSRCDRCLCTHFCSLGKKYYCCITVSHAGYFLWTSFAVCGQLAPWDCSRNKWLVRRFIVLIGGCKILQWRQTLSPSSISCLAVARKKNSPFSMFLTMSGAIKMC